MKHNLFGNNISVWITSVLEWIHFKTVLEKNGRESSHGYEAFPHLGKIWIHAGRSLGELLPLFVIRLKLIVALHVKKRSSTWISLVLQESLPEYFAKWDKLGKNCAELLLTKKLREEISKVSKSQQWIPDCLRTNCEHYLLLLETYPRMGNSHVLLLVICADRKSSFHWKSSMSKRSLSGNRA